MTCSFGLCQCGCGMPVSIARRNDPRRGFVKGQPVAFRQGHRLSRPGGYKMARANGVNRSIHRQRAEKALGKPLPPGAVVHHADGSKSVTAPLVICQDVVYHNFLHARMRVKAHGGDPNTERWCPLCQRLLPFEAFDIRRDGDRNVSIQSRCRPCANKETYRKTKIRRSAQRQAKREAAGV